MRVFQFKFVLAPVLAVAATLALTTTAGADQSPVPTPVPSPEYTTEPAPPESAQAVADESSRTIQAALRAALPASLGGVWIEHSENNAIHVSVTDSSAAALVRTTVAALPLKAVPLLVISTVAATEANLRAATDALGEAAQQWRSKGVRVWYWVLDVRNNTLVIKLEPGSDPTSEEQLKRAYAVPLALERKEPQIGLDSRTTNFAELRAGLNVIGGSQGFSCTAGFNVQSTHNSGYYFLTAGHCDVSGSAGIWYEGSYNGNNLGTSGTNLAPKNSGVTSNCDCLAIGPISGARATNVIYTSDSGGIGVTGICGYNCFASGNQVCMSGATSGVQCASSLYAYSTGCADDGRTTFGLGQAMYTRAPGDSGAPVYSGSTAIGLHSGYCNNIPTFSWIDKATAQIAVNVLTSNPS